MTRTYNGKPIDEMTAREKYLAHLMSFEAYYRGIALAAGIAFDPKDPFIDRVRGALANGDDHLNTISLRVWDQKACFLLPGIKRAFEVQGDSDTLAGRVCVLKQAARDAAEKSVTP